MCAWWCIWVVRLLVCGLPLRVWTGIYVCSRVVRHWMGRMLAGKKEEERGQEAGLMMILAMRPNARRARAISLVPLGRAAPSSAWQIRYHLGTAHPAHSFSFKPEPPACTPPLRHILAGKAGNLQVGERSP